MNVRKGKLPFLMVVVGTLVATGIFLTPGSAYALSVFTPFGGRILAEVPCTCSGSAMITVGLPKPGIFILTPLSRIHRNYQPFPGKWVLGIASGVSACLVVVPIPVPPFVTCVPVGAGGVIVRMGTS